MAELVIMRNYDHPQAGDTKHSWNPGDAGEVAGIRAMFDRMRQLGHVAYSVNEDGSRGTVLHHFDPQAGKIIMRPPIAGG